MGFGEFLGGASDLMNITGGVANLLGRRAQWRREDTAVQRRVKDLEAAGLSPVLAAGSAAASTTSPIGNTSVGSYSDAKRKDNENKLTKELTRDAKNKADISSLDAEIAMREKRPIIDALDSTKISQGLGQPEMGLPEAIGRTYMAKIGSQLGDSTKGWLRTFGGDWSDPLIQEQLIPGITGYSWFIKMSPKEKAQFIAYQLGRQVGTAIPGAATKAIPSRSIKQ